MCNIRDLDSSEPEMDQLYNLMSLAACRIMAVNICVCVCVELQVNGLGSAA
jgi:hypothetical protein